MKAIPNKIVQEKEDGVTIDVNYPASEIPSDGQRYILDGNLQQWLVATDKTDEAILFQSYPELKAIDDGGKQQPKGGAADAGSEEIVP